MEGTYEILGVVGRTGLGTLYRARFTGEGGFTKLVNLKMLDEGVAESDEVACRLRDEARVLAFLKHQAIVQVDRLIRLAGRWTLVQEHVDGVDLEALIARSPVPAGPALEIAAGVAGALYAAFTSPGPDGSPLRLQHRDIKPATILIDAYGAPRVIDFGIARACFSGREAHTRSFVVGSFEYMAPERLALEEGGPWSDVYSLGQVLFALLTGQGFGRSHPSERHHKAILQRAFERLLALPGGIDEELLGLLGRMLALVPHERPDARAVERTCHEIVRRMGQETLRSWAEQAVEPLIHGTRAEVRGGLVGRVLTAGDAPLRPPSAVAPADPAVVGSRRAAAGLPERTPPRSLERHDPLPVITFSDAQEDDATEIMTHSRAPARPPPKPQGAVDIDDIEATDVFDALGGQVRPRGARPPVASSDEVFPTPGAARAGDLLEPSLHTAPMSAEVSLEDVSAWRDDGEEEPDPRPTAQSEAPGEGDRPTRVDPWVAPGARGPSSEIRAEAQPEVTMVTPTGAHASDGEDPTFQQHAALASEPTALLGDRDTGALGGPDQGGARFNPERVLSAGSEVAPAAPAAEEREPEPVTAGLEPTAPLPGDRPTGAPEPGVAALPTLAEEPPPDSGPAPPEPEPEPPVLPPPPVLPRPVPAPPSETWIEPRPPAPAMVQHGGPRRWTPSPKKGGDHDRPQPDEWVPPSVDTLRQPAPAPPPTLPPTPVAEHDETFVPPAPPPAPPADDTLVSRPEPEPTLERVTPLPTAPVGAITEVVDAPLPTALEATVEEDDAPAPPAQRAPPARRRRLGPLLIALVALVLGGAVLVALIVAAGVAWLVLG